jgi:hypothetical protein
MEFFEINKKYNVFFQLTQYLTQYLTRLCVYLVNFKKTAEFNGVLHRDGHTLTKLQVLKLE